MVRSVLVASAVALVVSIGASGLAVAQGRDQEAAYEEAKQGKILPLGDIIARVSPRVGGSFLGSEFDPGSRTYRLKYMRGGNVVVVDVDARSGTILNITGK